MAVVVFAVSRNGQPSWNDVDVGRAMARARPENLGPTPFECRRDKGTLAAVDSPGRYARIAPCAAAVGVLTDTSKWRTVGTVRSDFASAVFRADLDVAEIATDAAGSRTIWYVFSDKDLIASTSQRVLVVLMRTFQMNQDAVPWMLVSGNLGPRLSWDRRIRCIPPHATLRLDRLRWDLEIVDHPVSWSVDRSCSEEEHVARLRDALDRTFAALPLSTEMLLPLSGGYDSRAILLFLRRHSGRDAPVRAITWGTRAALRDPGSDASIARELCRSLGVEHSYIALDGAPIPFPDLFRRFVAIGEGRLDHIGGYTDGFAMWKRLHDEGVSALLRGDMGFGYPPALTERDVRLQTGIPVLEDCADLAALPGLRAMPMPWPAYLERARGESCTRWNARLGHSFRLATTLAALTQLKTPFVEVVNPLLAPSLLECARALPPALFTRKRGFARIVESLSPPVPFASSTAISSPGDTYGTPAARAFLRALLEDKGRSHLPRDLIDAVVPGLGATTRAAGRGWRAVTVSKAKNLLPRWAGSVMRSGMPLRLGPATLAFRAGIITEICELLAEDATTLGPLS